ncbi:hypothetical protein [Clostridium sp. 'White wine YQ']|uniref:hypothetical protein n=1 Tax=Clostridium sp. 'White wine YQ' TaxID=3027474 RepID=UPI002366E6C0|nr:hypothetical protein [Clostridium sp. 'White wine YQ']MDD7796309.1 hypothetical protein [Clostridium sp. 'White wine YQ']
MLKEREDIMDKTLLSIRPNKQISALFMEIQQYHEIANRNEIVNWAIEKAIDHNIDWRTISKFKIDEDVDELKQPDFMQIRVEKNKYNAISEEIKEFFGLERVTAPYLIRLVLANYLSSLKNIEKNKMFTTSEKMIDFGIDCMVFKNEYDTSNYQKKEILLELCRKYLENCNLEMNESIRKQINLKIEAFSDYFNVNKYYPPRRSTLGKCNIIYVSKVLAGLFLVVAEIDGYDIGQLMESFQQKIENEKSKI